MADVKNVIQFEDQVKLNYHEKLHLKNVTRTVAVNGSSVKFPTILSNLSPVTKSWGAEFTLTQSEFAQVEVTMTDAYAIEFVQDLEQFKTNFSIQNVLAERVGRSLARKYDTTVLAAYNLATQNVKVDVSEGDNIFDQLLEAADLLNQAEVDPEDRFFVVKWSTVRDLMKLEKFTSANYNPFVSLKTGKPGDVYGMSWLPMPDSYFADAGGSGYRGTLGFLVHKDAVGVGVGSDIKTRMDYSPIHGGDIIKGTLSMGAKIIDPKGIVEIEEQA